ncbi:uncharacterized protein VNE69_02133 [Vairimorpha necatrix]|uniref:Membrane protein n=1 Tax=Vairimorpha necatrix TaxID=6039 RepID=A0AAX4J9E2_9MICR
MFCLIFNNVLTSREITKEGFDSTVLLTQDWQTHSIETKKCLQENANEYFMPKYHDMHDKSQENTEITSLLNHQKISETKKKKDGWAKVFVILFLVFIYILSIISVGVIIYYCRNDIIEFSRKIFTYVYQMLTTNSYNSSTPFTNETTINDF